MNYYAGGQGGKRSENNDTLLELKSKTHLGREGGNTERHLVLLELDNRAWVVDLPPQCNCVLRQVGNDGVPELCCPVQLFRSFVFPSKSYTGGISWRRSTIDAGVSIN